MIGAEIPKAAIPKAQATHQPRSEPLLVASGLTKRFQGLVAVDKADISVEKGRIHALIGPNGAGKSTLVSLLCGRQSADEGVILFQGRDITKRSAHERVKGGMAYTFQITSIFAGLSVLQNVILATQAISSEPATKIRAVSLAALERVGIEQLADELAGNLSYGHQRLLEVAMGIAQKPALLILDEPTQGLSEPEIDSFKALLKALTPTTTILLIEHNLNVVMSLSDVITVLTSGQVLAEGTPEEIRANRDVQIAYLGQSK